MNSNQELPSGWAMATLGSFTTIIGGSTPSRSEPTYFGGDIPWLTPTEVPKNTVAIINDTKEKLTEAGFKSSSVRVIPVGSVLLTSRASIGYVAIAGIPLTTNQGFASFVLPDQFEPRYLAWWLRSQKADLEDRAPGTTFKEISKGALRELSVPIPPLAEQRRIVAAIEEQFTRLDAGVAALKSARARLKQYRAAVLKAAVEGELTKEWREAHPETEPASELLVRVLAERRVKWEDELRAKGKANATARYDDPSSSRDTPIDVLPQGWCWTTLGQLSDATRPITYGVIKLGDPTLGGVLTLRSSDVRHLRLDLHNVKSISPDIAAQYKRTFLQGGEIVVTVRGTLGGVALVPPPLAGYNISREVAMISLVSPAIGPCITLFIGSAPIQSWMGKQAKGIAYTGINIETLKVTPVPLPPLAEQGAIVEQAEQRLSVITALEVTINAGLQRAERLRQSILTEAFAGRLVPQDQHDEPATMLLQKIRERSSKAEKSHKPTGTVSSRTGRRLSKQDHSTHPTHLAAHQPTLFEED